MTSLYTGAAFYIVSYGNPYGFWCGIMLLFLTKKIIGSTF